MNKLSYFSAALAIFVLLHITSAAPTQFLPLNVAQVEQQSKTTIVAIGGLSEGAALNSVDVIAVDQNGANKTKHGASLPQARQQFAGSLINKTIYITGGFGGNGQNFWSYDIAKDSWNKNVLPLPPVQVEGGAAAVLNGTIYVMGGSGFNSRHVYAFDVAKKEWSKLPANNPQTNDNPCLVAQNGALYYFTRQDMFRSADGAKSWKQVASAKVARSYSACAALGSDGVIVTGGYDYSVAAMDFVEIYNTTTDRWTMTAMPMQMARSQHAAATMPNGDDVIVCGGGGTDSPIGGLSCEIYDSIADEWTLTKFMMSIDRIFFGLYVF